MKKLVYSTLIGLICFYSAFAQGISSVNNREAYRLLIEASNLKNKDRNCAAAVVLYEKALSLRDFKMPGYYQSLASCYAQIDNKDRAFFYLDKLLSVGWLDAESLKRDEILKPLLSDARGVKFLSRVNKAKIKFAKDLLPENYGVNDNPAIKKIAAWRNDSTVSAEDFHRLVSDFDQFPQPRKTGVFVKFTNRFSDKITAPFYVYVPTEYDAAKPHSLLVYSPGGWFSRKDFAPDEAKDFVFENPALPFVEKNNFLEVFPAGAGSVGTYQFEGIENIRQIIARVKQIFNVDDNRVYMMGFSDGGTGTYRMAVFMPTAFASFYAVNGRPYVNNQLMNMSNRPFYSLSSTEDTVYEIGTMRSFFSFADTVGADWTYREVAGQGHYYLPFLEDYLPAIFAHMRGNSRRAFRHRLNWTTTWAPIGKIDWLEISEIDKSRPGEDWHKIYEYPLNSSKGIETIKIGDDSAAVNARFYNNTFEINASRVARLTVNLHPVMVDFSQPVRIIVNGKEVFNQKISLDKEFMWKTYAENYDRSLLWANKVIVEVSK